MYGGGGSDWCTIESDPGVFTALCEEIGVKGVQFEELYTLDESAFVNMEVNKIYGLIFLFKWESETDARPTVDAQDAGLFFAKQVIHNACATQAILSVLMNNTGKEEQGLEIGETLKALKEFTKEFPPEAKGLAIGNSDPIKRAHNSFRHQSSFEIVHDKNGKSEDAFHFIGYIVHNNKVYELDGLKEGPALIGEVPSGVAWVEPAREEIQRRIETYSKKAAEGGSELRFNAMAITADKLREAEMKSLREKYVRIRAKISLISRGEDHELDDEVDDDDAPKDIPTFEDLEPMDVADVQAMVTSAETTIKEMEAVIQQERKKRDQWKKENALRRHDLVPLALCAMRHLARSKQLVPAFQKGKETHLKRVEEKKAAEAATATAA